MNYTFNEVEDKVWDLGFDMFQEAYGGYYYSQSNRLDVGETTLSLSYHPGDGEITVGIDVGYTEGDCKNMGIQDFMENVWYIGVDQNNALIIEDKLI